MLIFVLEGIDIMTYMKVLFILEGGIYIRRLRGNKC